MHNPTAGVGQWSASRVNSIFATRGAEIRYLSTKDQEWRTRMHTAVGQGTDLIVVIGGDGTVGKVVTELAGSPTPIRVVPAGTANNFARSVGVTGPASPDEYEEAVTDMPNDVVAVDVPVLGGYLSGPFVESVGGGVFARLLTDAERAEAEGASAGRLADGLNRLLDLSRHSPATSWRLWLDGDEISGRLWGIEVLNIGAIGPRVPLAPNADPGDGLLDCVLLGDEHRQPMIDYLSAALERCDSDQSYEPLDGLDLPVRRCRAVTAECPAGTLLHVDDRSFETEGPAKWTASIDGTTVRIGSAVGDLEEGWES